MNEYTQGHNHSYLIFKVLCYTGLGLGMPEIYVYAIRKCTLWDDKNALISLLI